MTQEEAEKRIKELCQYPMGRQYRYIRQPHVAFRISCHGEMRRAYSGDITQFGGFRRILYAHQADSEFDSWNQKELRIDTSTILL